MGTDVLLSDGGDTLFCEINRTNTLGFENSFGVKNDGSFDQLSVLGSSQTFEKKTGGKKNYVLVCGAAGAPTVSDVTMTAIYEPQLMTANPN